MSDYDHDIYRRNFARLLNKALKRGKNDPRQALDWLDKRYKLVIALLFTRFRLESTDAYMDVREHITERIKSQNRGNQVDENGD